MWEILQCDLTYMVALTNLPLATLSLALVHFFVPVKGELREGCPAVALQLVRVLFG